MGGALKNRKRLSITLDASLADHVRALASKSGENISSVIERMVASSLAVSLALRISGKGGAVVVDNEGGIKALPPKSFLSNLPNSEYQPTGHSGGSRSQPDDPASVFVSGLRPLMIQLENSLSHQPREAQNLILTSVKEKIDNMKMDGKSNDTSME